MTGPIRTERLLLRTLCVGDAEAVCSGIAAHAFLAHAFAAGVGNTIYSGAFADNAASLRVQAKLGFVRDGETMLYAKPRGDDFPHIDTRLTRSAFQAQER